MSHALVYEAGPWDCLIWLRTKTGIAHDDTGQPIAWPDGNVLSCVWCLSPWVAAGLLLAPITVMVVFAVSTVAILIEERLLK